MKKLFLALVLGASALLAGCQDTDANVASRNLSEAADNFQIARRIVFINGMTDTYLMEIAGFCSLGNEDKPGRLTVTCKTGPGQFKKHFLGLSDNVTFFVEQLDAAHVSTDFYKVTFKPTTIIPDIQIR
jgi:predicted small secreted protein